MKEFDSVDENGKARLIEAAKALGLGAMRGPDGGISLVIAAAALPPALRELAHAVGSDAPMPATATEILVRVLLWARRNGHDVGTVVAEAAGLPLAGGGELRAATDALDRLAASSPSGAPLPPDQTGRYRAQLGLPEASGPASSGTADPVVAQELEGYLARLARIGQEGAGHHLAERDAHEREIPDESAAAGREAPDVFFDRLLATGTFVAAASEPRDFPDFVRRATAEIRRAVERHGYTPRLRHMEEMFQALRERGPEAYGRDDPARAARLMAMWPALVDQLENYEPDPDSSHDRPVEPHPLRRP